MLKVIKEDFLKASKLTIQAFEIKSGDVGTLERIKKEFGEEAANKAKTLANFYESSSFIKRVEKELNCKYIRNGMFAFKELIINEN